MERGVPGVSDYEDRINSLGSADRAEFERHKSDWMRHGDAKNYDAAEASRQQMNEVVFPERRTQRLEHEQRTAEFERNHLLAQRQFYHGTDAKLRKGDEIKSASALGRPANWETYGNQDWTYAANGLSGMGTARGYAEKVAEMRQTHPYIYEVDPTGSYERDPDDINGVRSSEPWRVVRRVPRKEW